MKVRLYLFCLLSVFLISCTQVTNEEEPEILSSLEITSFPKKMVYNKGEYFSSDGLAVKAVFSNGTYKENFTVTMIPPSGSRLMTTGKQDITVSAGGLKKSFSIQVDEAIRSSIKITKSPEKTIYISGETFDSTGIQVSEIFTDDTSKILSPGAYTLNPSDGTEFTEIKKVKLQASVPGFSDNIALQVYGVTEDDSENPNQYLYYTIENNEVAITGIAKNCTAHNIVIPEKLGEYPVTKIENLSTYCYDQVTSSPIVSLKIPSSVKTISDEALYNIASLEKIDFSEGIETIGKAAFQNCYGLKDLKFPESLTFIGTGAFMGCTALSSVEIPSEECIISESSFIGCPIKNLIVANMHDVYDSDGMKLSNYGIFSGTEPLTVTYTGTKPRIGFHFFDGAYVEKIVYPEGRENVLTTVGSYAFNEASVSEKVLPKGIKTIEDKAFAEAVFYENRFVLPESVEIIGSKVFYFDSWKKAGVLEEFRFPSSVKWIGKDSIPACKKLIFACNIADGCLFEDRDLDSRIENIEFEEGVTVIGSMAFGYLFVGFPEQGSFKVKLPSTIQRIEGSFGGRKPFLMNEKFDFPNLKYCGDDFKAGNEAGEAVLYDMEYCRNSFDAEDGWNLVTMKGELDGTYIAIYPKKFVVADEVTSIWLSENSDGIKKSIFIAAQEIVLGKGITEIPDGHYPQFSPHGWGDMYNGKIQSVTIQGDVKTIPNSCFWACPNLSSVILPATVETIEAYAFVECPLLEKIVIPENVKTIGKGAFRDSGLKEIKIPSVVTSIGNDAFKNTCVETLVLENLNDSLIFGDGVFSNCEKLKSVTIDICSLGTRMFADCKNLESITFTKKVTTIPANAFLNCDSLQEVTIPKSVTSIENGGGFNSCLSLTKVKYEGTTIPCGIGAPQILKEITVKEGSDWESKFSEAIKNRISSGDIKLIKEQ